ncbi:SDR family oxidoreductase [Hymenobacter cellulosivorans]|uniref:SDR family oxidoreductase n=1 Tax=Hymenobacter cellulosivorans TaxID=2932249 RepID=A0ABY4FAG6_9BACT|nr:SDR family oxidoreductase [Hymenobacter cellulosivorans]UOQ53662.1 SDR family oxidoreductase [Hymenobacter cellulosivorans]
MSFSQQVVWITGASAGIGEALAKEYARAGARLVLSARNVAELERVAAACAPAEVLLVPLDLGQADTLQACAEKVLGHYGRLDVLVNNGGISQRSLALDTSLDVHRRLMEVNYFGTVALTKAVLPQLLSQKSGQIVVVSSLVGKFGSPYRSAYAASKHALHGFFDSLRAEIWQSGVGITIICPGFVRTGVSINALTADGSPQQTMDAATEQGLAPEKLAHKAIRAIAQRREEVYIGGRETLGVYLKRLAPGLFSRILRKAQVR